MLNFPPMPNFHLKNLHIFFPTIPKNAYKIKITVKLHIIHKGLLTHHACIQFFFSFVKVSLHTMDFILHVLSNSFKSLYGLKMQAILKYVFSLFYFFFLCSIMPNTKNDSKYVNLMNLHAIIQYTSKSFIFLES
jgi:hypothetical protein